MARSLDSARLRAETRVQRFLDAAIELFNSGSGKDFTVQEVVDRSGQSLRSFYQYFGGKHELLLALFEESVRSTTEYLRDKIGRGQCARASALLRGRVLPAVPAGAGGPVRVNGRAPFMAEFAQQLLTEHPKEAARVFSPLVSPVRRGPRRGRRRRGRPGRAASRPHRGRGARGDHVQHLLGDDRRHVGPSRTKGARPRICGI